MKGLICYARFLVLPGIEKLANFYQAKSSFLMSVTPGPYQRTPFSLKSVEAAQTRISYDSSLSRPSTFLSVAGSRLCGVMSVSSSGLATCFILVSPLPDSHSYKVHLYLSTVFSFLARMARSGYARLKVAPGRVLLRAFRFFSQNRASGHGCVGSRGPWGPQPVLLRHFVKEYIMTLTDNIRGIETHAQLALKHTDEREYKLAHCDLDVIEKKVRAVRDHLEHLQDVTPRSLVPAGGD